MNRIQYFKRLKLKYGFCANFSTNPNISKGLPKKIPIPEVKNIILIASGKGGVGKSTTAVNLSIALSQIQSDSSIGLLDADVFGPSIPKMFNLENERPILNSQNMILPLNNYGLKLMSMGFLVDNKDSPIVWRGLMVMSAIQKLLRQVLWGPLDYLVVDMPPGTGDVQLSIVQNVPVSGAVIVSTPQDVALIDARKGAQMFTMVNVPVLGLIQNMSLHVCSKCGHHDQLFGDNKSALQLTKDLDIPFLGELPLDRSVCAAGDSGKPVLVQDPDSDTSKLYKTLAANIVQRLETVGKKSSQTIN